MKNIKLFTNFMKLACASFGLFVSCEIQEDFKYKPSDIDAELNMTAFEYIQKSDSLVLLHEAVVKTGLQELFQQSTERKTFIMPENRAFHAYLKDNGYSRMDEIPVPILRNMIRYHVVKDEVIFTDPELAPNNRPIAYETENGQIMYLSHNSNYNGLINEGTNAQWQIKTSNLVSTNGVIHVTSAIVYYSAPTVDAPDPNLLRDTIYPIHDTFVEGGPSVDKNFGLDELLKVKNVTGRGEVDRKAFLMFDLNDFKKEGVITDMRMELAVKFTHGKGVRMDLFETPDTEWKETNLTFNNAVFPETPAIASIVSSKVSAFYFNVTDFYKTNETKRKVSFMLDGQAGSDETDELASKDNKTLRKPMLIATLATGAGTLVLESNEDVAVPTGGVFVFEKDALQISGATSTDITYTIDMAPQHGWLIKGQTILQQGGRFTQLDIDLKNLVFIHNGKSSEADVVVLSARDKTGSLIDQIEVTIKVQ